MLALIGLAAAGGVLFVALLGRINERRWNDWESLLNANDQALCTRMRNQLDGSLAIADYAYDRAAEQRAVGSVDEAIRLLDLCYVMIERAAPDLRRLLAGFAIYSRMASALRPPHPPRRPAAAPHSIAKSFALLELTRSPTDEGLRWRPASEVAMPRFLPCARCVKEGRIPFMAGEHA